MTLSIPYAVCRCAHLQQQLPFLVVDLILPVQYKCQSLVHARSTRKGKSARGIRGKRLLFACDIHEIHQSSCVL